MGRIVVVVAASRSGGDVPMTLRREKFRSADLGEAEVHIQRNYGSVGLYADDLTFAERSVGDERFTLRSLQVEGAYRAEVDLAAVIVVQSAHGYHWEVDGRHGTATAPVLFQPGPLTCRLSDTTARVVTLSRDTLTDVARAVYNDDRLEVRFDGHRAVTPSLLRAWRSAAALAFEAAPRLHNDLVRASVFRSLAVSTLEAFALSGERRERAESARSQQAAYRKAVAFFDDHASLPVSVEDAAAAAGVGTAALERAFRTYSTPGRSPMEHLESVRLDAAHRDLVDGAAGTTVSGIAERWGFSEQDLVRRHAGTYGTTPDAVLER
ncbi:helix-turn-helix domain-containing protein [Microbacterium sp. 179-B 1A2 NHS]|uniref:helix-turn-helix domain-containing protein n=1 Tax=Microbacterium sp. 179-B 1A2 NHS TaxID=3142383 RepID=UPI0039A288DC